MYIALLYQDMASFKIATLQKTREDSVAFSELEAANKQYQELTEKYRDLLEKSNSMVASNEHSATLEVSGEFISLLHLSLLIFNFSKTILVFICFIYISWN